MSRYISFCSRCAMPNGKGKDLCPKCQKIITARKVFKSTVTLPPPTSTTSATNIALGISAKAGDGGLFAGVCG